MFGSSKATQALAQRAKALRERKDAQHRCALAKEMGDAFGDASLTQSERKLALDIIKKLVTDEISSVRAATAQAVAASPYLPKSVAARLAQDISEVSLPVLELSPVLEEWLLEEIVKSGVAEKIRAVAKRENVSPNLCRHIIASGRKGAVICLLNNKGAQITDQSMVNIVRVYGDDEYVEEAIVARGALSEDVLKNLRDAAESHVHAFIKRHFKLTDQVSESFRPKKITDKADKIPHTGHWWH